MYRRYGDRLPLSTIARLIAIVWTLTGVVILGILVGSIAVSLTYQTVGIDYKLYGAKVNFRIMIPSYDGLREHLYPSLKRFMRTLYRTT